MSLLRSLLVSGLLNLAVAGAVSAAPIDDLPTPVREGLKAYPEGSHTVAVDAWMRHVVAENAADVKAHLAGLQRVERLYGAFDSVDIVHRAPLSNRAQRLYLAMHFERGVVWIVFDVYQKRDQQWVINGVRYALNPVEILPEPILVRK